MKKLKQSVLSASITLMVSLLVMTGCNSEPETHSKSTAENTEDVAPIGHTAAHGKDSADKTIIKPNFDIKAADYGKQVKAILEGTEFAEMTLINVIEGNSGNAFIIDYPHHINLSGEVSESEQLEKLTYTMPTNEQLEKSSAKLSQLVTASMQVLNPELSEADAKKKVSSLLDQALSKFILEKTQQRSVGVLKDRVYVCEISDKGVRVVIEPTEGSRYLN